MIDHLSYSSIRAYLKCGRKWKYRYIEKLQEEKSNALSFGGVWHEMLSAHLKTKQDLNEWWQETAIEKLDLPLHDLGTKMLTSPDIVNTIQDLKVDHETIDMETSLTVPNVSVPIIGYVDAIGVDGVPIDFKTSSSKWSQSNADSDLQPTFYLASLLQMGQVTLPAKFKYIVFVKTKKPYVQTLETTRTLKDVFALYGLIGDVWSAIQKEVYSPTDPANWWCGAKYCGFWGHCEYGGKNAGS